MVQPYDDGVATPGEIIWIGVDAFNHDLIELAKGIDVTGSHPDNHSRMGPVLDLLFPVPVIQLVRGKVFAEGKEEVFWRNVGTGVIHLKLLEIIELQKPVNLISICVPIAPFGPDDLIALHEALYHLPEIVFSYRFIEHSYTLISFLSSKPVSAFRAVADLQKIAHFIFLKDH
jgi:hypothetical protein